MPSNKSAYSHLQRPLSTLVDLCVEAVLTQHRHAERFSALTTFLDGLPDPVDYNGLVLALCWYGDERIRTELLAVLEINKTARWVLKPFSDQGLCFSLSHANSRLTGIAHRNPRAGQARSSIR